MSVFANIVRPFSYAFMGLVVVSLIVYIKPAINHEGVFYPVLVLYTLFVSFFTLSRLLSAFFYKRALRSSVPTDISFEPIITFCIPCKNEEDGIFATIDRCFAVEYPKEKVEVIVINDGSTDGTMNEIRRAEKKYDGLRVIDWSVNRGKKHAMAAAVLLARGSVLVQIDSDSFVTPGTFRHLVMPFANERIGAVCAHADPENAGKNLLTKMQAAYYFMSFRILKAGESSFSSVFCCSGCCSAYRMSVLKEVINEWLEERFLGVPTMLGEDRALTSAVLKAGYETIYSDDVQSYTICPETFQKFFKQQLRWKKSWITNSLIMGRYIYRTHPFVAYTYFYPLVVTSFLTPFFTVAAILYIPIVRGTLPFNFIAGILLMTSLFVLMYRYVRRENKYWPYLFLWTLFNVFAVNFLFFVALVRFRDQGWGTR